MDMTNVEFLWASDEINARPNEYWLRVMDVARRFNVPRIVRCCTIMGRKEGDDLSAAQIFYPAMQCADVFFLKADICQLGMDQRKVRSPPPPDALVGRRKKWRGCGRRGRACEDDRRASLRPLLARPQVNMLAREYCDATEPKIKFKPIVLSHREW
jgi:hypothetical protein